MSALRDRISAQRKNIADSKAAFERPYRFKTGKTVVRVLPGTVTDDEFSKPYGAHYIKDPRDGDKIIAVVGDAEICYAKVCPVRNAIVDYIDRCNAAGDEAMAKKAKEWLARDSYVVNAEIVGGVDTENNGKVVRIEFSRNQYDQVLSVMETLFMANPEFTMKDGLAIVIERTGTGVQDTKYSFQAFPGVMKPPTQAALDGRMDLQSYVDGKFGMSVTKALTHMSTLLGKDVTSTAIGSALTQAAAQLSAPSATTATTTRTTAPAATTTAPATTSADDDLLALVPGATATNIVEAEFEDVNPLPPQQTTAATAPAATTAAPVEANAQQFDSILAELDALV